MVHGRGNLKESVTDKLGVGARDAYTLRNIDLGAVKFVKSNTNINNFIGIHIQLVKGTRSPLFSASAVLEAADHGNGKNKSTICWNVTISPIRTGCIELWLQIEESEGS